jgi:hypothetical protein
MDGWSNVEDDLDLDLDIPQNSLLRPDNTVVTSVPDGWVVDHEDLDLDLDENVLSKEVNTNVSVTNVSESKQKESIFESYIQSEADGWGNDIDDDINIVDTNDIVQTKYQHVQELSSAAVGASSDAPFVAVTFNSPIVTNTANIVIGSHLSVLESTNVIKKDTVTSPIYEEELSRIKDSDKEEEAINETR